MPSLPAILAPWPVALTSVKRAVVMHHGGCTLGLYFSNPCQSEYQVAPRSAFIHGCFPSADAAQQMLGRCQQQCARKHLVFAASLQVHSILGCLVGNLAEASDMLHSELSNYAQGRGQGSNASQGGVTPEKDLIAPLFCALWHALRPAACKNKPKLFGLQCVAGCSSNE